MNNISSSSKQRVNEIDLLRFIAAISVVFFHYTFIYIGVDKSYPYPFLREFFEYGYLGVQLFFMVSGFVIFMTASSGGVKNFIASRVSRLYPAFWVCCSLTFAVRVILGGG